MVAPQTCFVSDESAREVSAKRLVLGVDVVSVDSYSFPVCSIRPAEVQQNDLYFYVEAIQAHVCEPCRVSRTPMPDFILARTYLPPCGFVSVSYFWLVPQGSSILLAGGHSTDIRDITKNGAFE